jgi:hypothetical protein
MVEKLGEVMSSALQPLLAIVKPTQDLKSDTDSLLQAFDRTAKTLQEVENRAEAGESRESDSYFRLRLRKRLDQIKTDLERSS